jgi:hypothetical protein
MKKWQAKAIQEIMDEFNFASVRKVMVALDWTWGNTPSIPSIDELRRVANRQLTQMCEKNQSAISSGGFDCTYNKKDKCISLSFIVEEWVVCKRDIL